MGQLLLIALGTFASEDLTCIATGALISMGMLGFVPGVVACLIGILAGDLLLYAAGRFAGQWEPVQTLLNSPRFDRASQWLAERGAMVVLLSRFTPGLRLPTYVAAGLLKTRFWTFAWYFFPAAAIWTPVLVGSAALLGRKLPSLALFGPAVLFVVVPWRRVNWTSQPWWHLRRRTLGWLLRKTRWEFWPPWLAYLPLVPYILYLGLKHRSVTLFTAANPGISSGGFVGESKSKILSCLGGVPDFKLVPASLLPMDRVYCVQAFMRERGLSYPVVLKPDVGERGAGVAVVRTEFELRKYLDSAICDTIVQRFVGGFEFGVFYYRYPGTELGRIFSITEKRFPEVVGDGHSTMTDLVLSDDRAVCLANVYLARFSDSVPAVGERVRLVELGSHCRGAIFLNGARFETPELLEAVDAIAKAHDGFFMGRFDIRTPSIADLQAGVFEVLELNGVSAEPTHIYDPSVTLIDAYRAMYQQWRIAFEIGAINRAKGNEPMTIGQLMALVTGTRRVTELDRPSQPSLRTADPLARVPSPDRP